MNPATAIKQLRELSKNVKEMRLAAEDWKNGYEILVSTILSARTRDEMTIPVAEKLFKRYYNAHKLSKADIKDVESIIRSVNFYHNKSRNIINCAKALVKKYNGIIPYNFNELVELPGVGRKTANVFLAEHGKHVLPVDTHVAYISRKLGWAKSNYPHKVEEELRQLFPKKYWNKINSTLVRFGKTHTSRKQKDKILAEIKKIK